MIQTILHASLLSFGLILPLGVQNVFIFQQGATQKRFINALPAVITASICDTLLITLSVTGVSVLILTSSYLKTALLCFGVLFLTYMGWQTWKAESSNVTTNSDQFSVKKQILFAASVSLLNPHAILDTIGVIGTNSLQYDGLEKVAFSVTCIAVSWIWFLSLAITGRTAGKLDQSGKFMLVLNKISAIIIWCIAIYLIKGILKG
ncbi:MULTISPECIES: LysE/ArgO family amino acid transporter [Bacillaceae]|uniref:Lysine transporter LysE n=1 Tax=Gottfriedia luciferensis TaxID=178774 RepID=A0ABX2ZUR9_9BACI|nr:MULTISPECIES: LysE/ArgO family amino acid transporter [Bacillaceae]ODG93560.1 lysine transporter LysE [Gottfriedia luciferensis]PGZ93477.1 lysine transporter LysE [Bacillus sp. AFS029533]SFC41390.1 L-lysine exporter family protein LysE/ArgO [Bacillus sp. UNCCL81]